MLSSTEFIRQSLELHLFFARIMKEHSFFLEAGFTPKDSSWMQHADNFRREFDRLLAEAGLMGGDLMIGNPMLEQRVFMLNQRAMGLTKALAQFKNMLSSEVISCRPVEYLQVIILC